MDERPLTRRHGRKQPFRFPPLPVARGTISRRAFNASAHADANVSLKHKLGSVAAILQFTCLSYRRQSIQHGGDAGGTFAVEGPGNVAWMLGGGRGGED